MSTTSNGQTPARRPGLKKGPALGGPTGGTGSVEPTVPLRSLLTIIYEDDAIVVVNKRPGFPVVPTGGFRERSVVRALAAAGYGELQPIHRLEREVSGLVLMSRNSDVAKALRWNWRSNLCERTYLAVVNGDIAGARGRITLPIGSVRIGPPSRRRRVMTAEEGGRPAETRWKLLARGRGMSRLQITVGNARPHQVRIHLNAIGYPVVNDSVFRDMATEVPIADLVGVPSRSADSPKLPPYQVALHCARVSMPHPVTNEIVVFEAPVPRLLIDLMPGAWVVEGT